METLTVQYAEPDADACARIGQMHADALRILERQAIASDALDQKLTELLRIGLAGLAAGLALATLLIEKLPREAPALLRILVLGLVIVGAGATMTSLTHVLRAWGGFGRLQPSRREAPHPAWISAMAPKARFPLWEYQTAVIHAARKAHSANDREAQRVVRERRRAIRGLLAAGAAYSLAALLILSAVLVVT